MRSITSIDHFFYWYIFYFRTAQSNNLVRISWVFWANGTASHPTGHVFNWKAALAEFPSMVKETTQLVPCALWGQDVDDKQPGSPSWRQKPQCRQPEGVETLRKCQAMMGVWCCVVLCCVGEETLICWWNTGRKRDTLWGEMTDQILKLNNGINNTSKSHTGLFFKKKFLSQKSQTTKCFGRLVQKMCTPSDTGWFQWVEEDTAPWRTFPWHQNSSYLWLTTKRSTACMMCSRLNGFKSVYCGKNKQPNLFKERLKTWRATISRRRLIVSRELLRENH